MISFPDLWQLLYRHGATNIYRDECMQLWDSLTTQQKEQLFSSISQKLQKQKFVHYNPLIAMQNNIRTITAAEPAFLSGPEQNACFRQGIPIVQVRYNDRYLICTRQTMQQFGLEYVREWLPVE